MRPYGSFHWALVWVPWSKADVHEKHEAVCADILIQELQAAVTQQSDWVEKDSTEVFQQIHSSS